MAISQTELGQSTGYSYEGVRSPFVKKYLEIFERDIIQRSYFPVRIIDIANPPIPDVLGFKSADLLIFARRIRDEQVVDMIWTERFSGRTYSEAYVDQDSMRAIASLCGAFRIITFIHQEKERSLSTENLTKLVRHDTKILGQHALAAKIHEPSAGLTPSRSAPMPEAVYEIPCLTSAAVKQKTPEFTNNRLVQLACYGHEELLVLLNRIPNSADSVNFVKDAPWELVQAVMFILYADRHALAEYFPDNEDFPLFVFRSGLIRCLEYMHKYPVITNLKDLFLTVHKAYLKNPDRYLRRKPVTIPA